MSSWYVGARWGARQRAHLGRAGARLLRNSFSEAPLNLPAYKLGFGFSKGVSVEEQFVYVILMWKRFLSKSEMLLDFLLYSKRKERNVRFITFFVFRILVKMTKNEKISCNVFA